MRNAITFLLVCLIVNTPAYAQSALDDIRFSVDEYQIVGENPLGQKAYDALAPFVGDQYGLAGLSAASDALENALSKNGFSFHRVNLPPQELLSGSVILEIVEFKLGQIKVTGNQFFDDDNIRRSVPALKAGKTPNTIDVSQSIKGANKNGSKTVTLRFNEGETPDTIDAELKVIDRDPQTIFVSLDNSGGDGTEPLRMTLGYQHGNVFNKDHSVTLTYSTAPNDTDLATQIGLSYSIPFYDDGSRISFLFSDSESNSGTVADSDLVTGKGSVFGLTYANPIFSFTTIEQEWSVGFTQKLFDNTQLNTTSKVLSQPLDFGYKFTYRGANVALSGGANYAINVPFGSNSDNSDYVATGRANAKNDWSVVRYRFSLDYLIATEWLLNFKFSGQQTGDSLISGEQFGVGGSTTLRGFEERSVNGDEGYNVRLELWLPAKTALRWFVFSDQAHIELKETSSVLNDGITADLASVGVGARWSWKQQLNVELDLGVITKEGGADITINRKNDVKAHLSLVYRF